MKKFVAILMTLVIGLPLYAQNLRVTGQVTSADDGEPLIGATVRVKQSNSAGTVTDIDGMYSIDVPKGQTLVISYIGFAPYEKKITSAGAVDIAMVSEGSLDELVVIGYGSVKKSDLTGSVATVSGENMQKTPSPSLANALQGQAAGVTVNSLSGRPGASAEVRIRGVGTVNGASPIYVVDGMITDNIDFVAPNDIENTEILKDASATAIYGSRGANGVVIVTTKSGARNQRAHITLDGYVGWQSRWRKLDVMNSKDFADAHVAINGNASSKKYYAENGMNKWLGRYLGVNASAYYPTIYDPDTNPTGFNYAAQNTDWQDEVFRTGMIQNYHLSIDGGGDKFTYSASGSWFKQQGTIIGSDYSRTTVRLNTSYQATPWLKIGENVSFMSSVAKNTYGDGDNLESAGANILSAALAMAPWDPTHYPEGSVNRNGKDLSGAISAASNFKVVTNPFSMIAYSHPNDKKERFVGNAFIELTPLKHFVFKSTFNFDYSLARSKTFQDAYEVSQDDKRDKNFLTSSMARTFSYIVDNILNYNQDFGKHNVGAMIGQTVEEYNYYSIGNSGSTILNPVKNNWYLNQVTDDFGSPSDGVSRARRFSWVGRVMYNYDSRYLATINFRADGSSKFRENKWGYFPSFALAWRADRESFLRDVNWINQLKLRFGWGRVGNDNIGNDAFLLTMFNNGPTFVDYVFGKDQALANGATILTYVNNGGKWETTEQWSVGIDFGFWNNRLSGTIEGFIRDTYDMLMTVNAPAHVGNRYAGKANVGKVRNKGIEVTLNHQGYFGNGFRYSVGGNVSFIHNELTALNGGDPKYDNYDQVVVCNQGFPLYYLWGYNDLGIFRTDEEALEYFQETSKGNPDANPYTAADIPFHAGDTKYRDVNGDGRIDSADRVKIGSSIPSINYGINMSLAWKGIDLQLFFQGVAGNKIYNQMRMRLEGNGTTSQLSPIMKNAWTVDNPEGTIANPRNSVNYYTSDRFVEKGDYFRLKNLQLGYNLPEKWMKKIGMSSMRFYVQASNLFTATKYKGYDPEVSGAVDFGNYPQSRTFLVGFNIMY